MVNRYTKKLKKRKIYKSKHKKVGGDIILATVIGVSLSSAISGIIVYIHTSAAYSWVEKIIRKITESQIKNNDRIKFEESSSNYVFNIIGIAQLICCIIAFVKNIFLNTINPDTRTKFTVGDAEYTYYLYSFFVTACISIREFIVNESFSLIYEGIGNISGFDSQYIISLFNGSKVTAEKFFTFIIDSFKGKDNESESIKSKKSESIKSKKSESIKSIRSESIKSKESIKSQELKESDVESQDIKKSVKSSIETIVESNVEDDHDYFKNVQTAFQIYNSITTIQINTEKETTKTEDLDIIFDPLELKNLIDYNDNNNTRIVVKYHREYREKYNFFNELIKLLHLFIFQTPIIYKSIFINNYL